MVENQIAEGLESVVRAMRRLQDEGLSRHDAIHAVASANLKAMMEVLKSPGNDPAASTQARLDAALERLTAKAFLEEQEP